MCAFLIRDFAKVIPCVLMKGGISQAKNRNVRNVKIKLK